ncbi:MAG: hypothetical protein WBK55_09585 [Alphaproteobacteria bacterium]
MGKNKSDYNTSKDDDFSALRAVGPGLNSLSSEYPEINHIKDDLASLKDDVVSLTSHVKSNGGKHVDDAKRFAGKQLEKARKAGENTLHKMEHRVTEKPGQALAIAFFAGLAASFLLGKRR